MFIERLRLKKLLSFNEAEIELRPLNVLIGANAVGKSNLIEAIGLLQSASTDKGLTSDILRGGGAREWLWLGDPIGERTGTIECQFTLPQSKHPGPLLYELQFSESRGFRIVKESLRRIGEAGEVYFSRTLENVEIKSLVATMQLSVPSTDSVFLQYRSPNDDTPITETGKRFSETRIFREFRTGAGSPARYGVTTNARRDALADGGDNLALVLQNLHVRSRHERIREYLHRFCERFEDVKIEVGDGLARIVLQERGLVDLLSAIRVSDGTLKFLALLAVLFDPAPPPLICIEEPELGLHPDAMRFIAEALIEASQSVQLIVTTHSEALVDAFSDTPESVLICERDFDNGTQMKRLSSGQLTEWLTEYSLGELWRKGEIGGGIR